MLRGKKGLIFGIANDKSIAWGCAKALKEQGADFGVTYAGEIMEKRVRPLGEEIGADFIVDCDLTSEEATQAVMDKAATEYGQLDFIIHSVAFASKKALASPSVSDVSLQDFQQAMSVSAWTLLNAVKHAKPILNPGASVVTMTYYGAVKAIQNYGLMGIAKAALEAEVRYLANELGESGSRINAISAGAIRTLAASGIKGFRDMQSLAAEKSCIKQNVDQMDVGRTAAWLLSDMSKGTTGHILYVDHGYSVNG